MLRRRRRHPLTDESVLGHAAAPDASGPVRGVAVVAVDANMTVTALYALPDVAPSARDAAFHLLWASATRLVFGRENVHVLEDGAVLRYPFHFGPAAAVDPYLCWARNDMVYSVRAGQPVRVTPRAGFLSPDPVVCAGRTRHGVPLLAVAPTGGRDRGRAEVIVASGLLPWSRLCLLYVGARDPHSCLFGLPSLIVAAIAAGAAHLDEFDGPWPSRS